MDRSTAAARAVGDLLAGLDERRRACNGYLTDRRAQTVAEIDAKQADWDAFRATARAQVRRRGMHLAGGAVVGR